MNAATATASPGENVVLLEDLHPNQARVIDESKRFNVICCGRRFGKTVLGLDLAYDAALDGKPVGWFAPTYKLLGEPWKEARSTLRPAIVSANESSKQILLKTGGVIDFWTMDDPDCGRGRKYARVIIDEAAKARHLEESWTKAIRPTLADYRGDAWFLSTPRGQDYFWRLHCKAAAGEPGWAAWTMPTVANPYIDPEEVEAARGELPERVFAQEFLAAFLEESGSIFRRVREAIDVGRDRNSPPAPGHAYAIGADIARIEDFTVITVLDGHGRQVYHERFRQISWERQIAAIRAVADRYPGAVILDTTGVGDPIFEQLRKANVRVVPFVFTAPSKERLIDNLAIGLEQGRYRLMDLPVQTHELQAFAYELTPSRNVRMAAPAGFHDDCVMALALAAWGARRGLAVPETPEERAAREAADRDARARADRDWHSPDNPAWWS